MTAASIFFTEAAVAVRERPAIPQHFRLEGGRGFPGVRRGQIQAVPDDFRPDGGQGKEGVENVVVGNGFQAVGLQRAHHVRVA